MNCPSLTLPASHWLHRKANITLLRILFLSAEPSKVALVKIPLMPTAYRLSIGSHCPCSAVTPCCHMVPLLNPGTDQSGSFGEGKLGSLLSPNWALLTLPPGLSGSFKGRASWVCTDKSSSPLWPAPGRFWISALMGSSRLSLNPRNNRTSYQSLHSLLYPL